MKFTLVHISWGGKFGKSIQFSAIVMERTAQILLIICNKIEYCKMGHSTSHTLPSTTAGEWWPSGKEDTRHGWNTRWEMPLTQSYSLHIRILENKNTGILENWNMRQLEYLSTGIQEYLSTGIKERNNQTNERCQCTLSLSYSAHINISNSDDQIISFEHLVFSEST